MSGRCEAMCSVNGVVEPQCQLLAGHRGLHETEGGNWRWSDGHTAASFPADLGEYPPLPTATRLARQHVRVLAAAEERERLSELRAEIRRVEGERDVLREVARSNKRHVAYLAAIGERVRALADRAAGYDFTIVPKQIYDALDGTAADALTAAEQPGVDSGTSGADTGGSGDVGPADGAVPRLLLVEAVAAYFEGFLGDEGGAYRPLDFAEGLVESLAAGGWTIDATGETP